MPVWSWTQNGAAWADNTEQTVSSVAGRIKAIEIEPNGSQSAIAYVQVYNAANPNLAGGDVSPLRIPIDTNTNRGLQRKIKVLFPGAGLRFGTAITIFCSSDGGGTAPLGTVIPQEIKVYYSIGN